MTHKTIQHICFSFLTMILLSCAAKQPFYKNGDAANVDAMPPTLQANNIDYEIYFIGDVEADNSEASNQMVDLVSRQLSPYNQNQAVVFLGNFLPEDGLPEESESGHQAIRGQLEHWIQKMTAGTENLYFIPGNNEWNDGSDMTVAAIQASEDFIQELAGDKNIVVPSNGCGEPVKLDLTEELVLVLADSQWLLQGDDNTQRKRSGCDIDNSIEFVTYLTDVLARNKRKNVVVATHHPVISNGKIGGNYPLSSHMLPLPGVGTLVTGTKKIMGGPQKFGHPAYESYRAAIGTSLQNFEGVTMVSGHDRSLQYHEDGGNHFVVSGSGSTVDYARKADGSTFTYMSKGFSKITHTKNSELWLEFFVPDGSSKTGKLIYRKMLYKKEQIDFEDNKIFKEDKKIKTTNAVASKTYSEQKLIGGKLYRDAWGQEVEVPVLYLDDVHGGLKPIQQGGGFQTKSLRLENSKGQQYVLRSINKDVEKVVPAGLRSSFVKSLVQDGIGAAHPYGAFVIPTLADAAGIYHANPKAVYVPHQKALGDYDADFAERLYLFEERPGGKTAEFDSFGNTKKTVNTPSLLEKLRKSHKHVVDQEWTLRSRLFDIWVGDWDRHDDQWRWARFKEEDRTLYRPIPRDRDQVFFKNDGIINFISSRPFISPQLRKFEKEVDYVPGLVFNARYFDRTFLNQLERADFINMAEELQSKMTDELIDEAFSVWSKEVYDLNGEEIKAKLKKRRSDWVKYAGEYYDHLSKEVTVTGTDSKDLFEIEALSDDILDVKVYRLSDKGKKRLIFKRKVSGKETNELRLFGLKKSDQFSLTGDASSSVLIRIIGGSGSDMVSNRAKGLKPMVYDKPQGISLEGNPVNSKIEDKKGVNRYDRKDWKLNRKLSFPMITFYTDEGIGLSYNYLWTKHGFRSDPYKSNHALSVSYFLKNSAILANYSGHYPKAFGDWDFKLGLRGTGPTFTQYFYGLGNSYVQSDSTLAYHIVKGTQINVNPSFIKPLKNDQSISITPSYEYLNLKDTDDDPRFVLEEGLIPAEQFDNKHYAGLKLGYHNARIDNAAIPARGFVFETSAEYKINTTDTDVSFLRLATNLATYIPFSQSKNVVLAMNIGGAYSVGDYEFYHANYLSTPSRLRGFKSNRFGGDGMAYHATDLRIKLAEGKGGFPFGFGVFGAFDYGRVWLDNDLDEANDWHTSYGGGLYITPLGMLGLKFGYYVGEDDTQISLGGALAF